MSQMKLIFVFNQMTDVKLNSYCYIAILEIISCPVDWCCRIYECPENETKQSDSETPVMLGLWGMWSTPSLPSVRGPLWPGVVVPDRVLSMGQIELN